MTIKFTVLLAEMVLENRSIKIICGYVIADSGKILIDGKELGKDIDFPENLGALIENPGFIWYQSGFENFTLSGAH